MPPFASVDEPIPPPIPEADLIGIAADTPSALIEGLARVAIQPLHPIQDDANGFYRVVSLSAFQPDPVRFHDFDYRGTLRGMIEAVIEQEGPLRADVLAQRIARAHGWLRTGAKIRERIDLHLRNAEKTVESSGEFVWKKGSVTDVMSYRSPFDASSRRSVADIPLAELASIVVVNKDLMDESDPALSFARLLGVERLAAGSRSRLDEAIARARAHLDSPTAR